MANISVTSYTASTDLTEDDCVDNYIDILDEIKDIIKKFDEKEYTDFLDKCEKLNNDINNKKKELEYCYTKQLLPHSLNIDNATKDFLQNSKKYSKCLTTAVPHAQEPIIVESKIEETGSQHKDSEKEKVILEGEPDAESECTEKTSKAKLSETASHSELVNVSDSEHTADPRTISDPVSSLKGVTYQGSSSTDNAYPYIITTPVRDDTNNNFYSEIDSQKYIPDRKIYDKCQYCKHNNSNENDNIVIFTFCDSPIHGNKNTGKISRNSNHEIVRNNENSQNARATESLKNQPAHEKASSEREESNKANSGGQHEKISQDNITYEESQAPVELSGTNLHQGTKIKSQDGNELHDNLTFNNDGTPHYGSTQNPIFTIPMQNEVANFNHVTQSGINFFDIFNKLFAEIPLTMYMKFITTFLGSILLFMFLLKFTPLKFVFNKRRKKKRIKRSERLQRILVEPTHTENDIYVQYNPFQYYVWEDSPEY